MVPPKPPDPPPQMDSSTSQFPFDDQDQFSTSHHHFPPHSHQVEASSSSSSWMLSHPQPPPDPDPTNFNQSQPLSISVSNGVSAVVGSGPGSGTGPGVSIGVGNAFASTIGYRSSPIPSLHLLNPFHPIPPRVPSPNNIQQSGSGITSGPSGFITSSNPTVSGERCPIQPQNQVNESSLIHDLYNNNVQVTTALNNSPHPQSDPMHYDDEILIDPGDIDFDIDEELVDPDDTPDNPNNHPFELGETIAEGEEETYGGPDDLDLSQLDGIDFLHSPIRPGKEEYFEGFGLGRDVNEMRDMDMDLGIGGSGTGLMRGATDQGRFGGMGDIETGMLDRGIPAEMSPEEFLNFLAFFDDPFPHADPTNDAFFGYDGSGHNQLGTSGERTGNLRVIGEEMEQNGNDEQMQDEMEEIRKLVDADGQPCFNTYEEYLAWMSTQPIDDDIPALKQAGYEYPEQFDYDQDDLDDTWLRLPEPEDLLADDTGGEGEDTVDGENVELPTDEDQDADDEMNGFDILAPGTFDEQWGHVYKYKQSIRGAGGEGGVEQVEEESETEKDGIAGEGRSTVGQSDVGQSEKEARKETKGGLPDRPAKDVVMEGILAIPHRQRPSGRHLSINNLPCYFHPLGSHLSKLPRRDHPAYNGYYRRGRDAVQLYIIYLEGAGVPSNDLSIRIMKKWLLSPLDWHRSGLLQKIASRKYSPGLEIVMKIKIEDEWPEGKGPTPIPTIGLRYYLAPDVHPADDLSSSASFFGDSGANGTTPYLLLEIRVPDMKRLSQEIEKQNTYHLRTSALVICPMSRRSHPRARPVSNQAPNPDSSERRKVRNIGRAAVRAVSKGPTKDEMESHRARLLNSSLSTIIADRKRLFAADTSSDAPKIKRATPTPGPGDRSSSKDPYRTLQHDAAGHAVQSGLTPTEKYRLLDMSLSFMIANSDRKRDGTTRPDIFKREASTGAARVGHGIEAATGPRRNGRRSLGIELLPASNETKQINRIGQSLGRAKVMRRGIRTAPTSPMDANNAATFDITMSTTEQEARDHLASGKNQTMQLQMIDSQVVAANRAAEGLSSRKRAFFDSEDEDGQIHTEHHTSMAEGSSPPKRGRKRDVRDGSSHGRRSPNIILSGSSRNPRYRSTGVETRRAFMPMRGKPPRGPNQRDTRNGLRRGAMQAMTKEQLDSEMDAMAGKATKLKDNMEEVDPAELNADAAGGPGASGTGQDAQRISADHEDELDYDMMMP